jgi:hypothetical protein
VISSRAGSQGSQHLSYRHTCATIAATLAPYLHAIVAEVERRIAMVVSCGRTDALHHGQMRLRAAPRLDELKP